MKYSSKEFSEDEPTTFKGVVFNLWEEAKNIAMVWVVTGLSVIVLGTGLSLYRYKQNRDYMNKTFVPAFRESIIAEHNYVNHPSKTSEKDYFLKRKRLEEITRRKVIPKHKDPRHYIQFYTDFFYLSDCDEKIDGDATDYKSSDSCFLVFGKAIDNIQIVRKNNLDRKVAGTGYLLEGLQKFNVNKTGNFKITYKNKSYFIVDAANARFDGKDSAEYLKNEIKKLNPNIKD